MSKLVENGQVQEMSVSKNTNVHNLAISISKVIQEGRKARLIAVGANAVNQMVKAGAKSRGFLAPLGKDIVWKVFFTDRPLTLEERNEAEARGYGDRKETLSALVMESLML